MRTQTPPLFPRAEKARLERAEDELMKKERQRQIFASNLLKHTAFHSVQNIPDVVDHLGTDH